MLEIEVEELVGRAYLAKVMVYAEDQGMLVYY